MKINPIYFLVDSSFSVSDKLKIKRNDALNLLLEHLRQIQAKMDSIEVALIRVASSSRKVSSLKKLSHVAVPNFKSDKTRGFDLTGAFSILESDLSKFQQSNDYNKPKIILFLSSVPSIKKNELTKFMRLFDSLLVINVNRNINTNALNTIFDNVMGVEDFTINIDHVLNNWFHQNFTAAPSVTSPFVPPFLDYREEEETLSDIIGRASDGDTVTLMPKEYQGPISIDKPLKILGNGATIWGLRGPVLEVLSENVELENLKIEVTNNLDSLENSERIALNVAASAGLGLRNITVKGMVEGIADEEGIWEYPNSISLGAIAHKSIHEFKIRMSVPANCQLVSTISALSMVQTQLTEGNHELHFKLEPLSADLLLDGHIFINTQNVKRIISINGFISDQANAQMLTGDLLWEPKSTTKEEKVQVVQVQPETQAVDSGAHTAEPQAEEATENQAPTAVVVEIAVNEPTDSEVTVSCATDDSMGNSEALKMEDSPKQEEAPPFQSTEFTSTPKRPFERGNGKPDSEFFAQGAPGPTKEADNPSAGSKVEIEMPNLFQTPTSIRTTMPVRNQDFARPDADLFSIPIPKAPPVKAAETPADDVQKKSEAESFFEQPISVRTTQSARIKSTPLSGLFFNQEGKNQEEEPAKSAPSLFTDTPKPKAEDPNRKRKIVQASVPSFFQD